MAPSKYNAYGSTTFPAISDALYEANETGDINYSIFDTKCC